MNPNHLELGRRALAGLLGGIALAACEDKAAPPATVDAVGTPPAAPAPAGPVYAEIHGCGGQNACKGLGGCAVTAEALAGYAKAAGVDATAAGSPHSCAGQNACKGLGGCSVDAAKLQALKAALAGGPPAAADGHRGHAPCGPRSHRPKPGLIPCTPLREASPGPSALACAWLGCVNSARRPNPRRPTQSHSGNCSPRITSLPKG